jgi:hypothetical protein
VVLVLSGGDDVSGEVSYRNDGRATQMKKKKPWDCISEHVNDISAVD